MKFSKYIQSGALAAVLFALVSCEPEIDLNSATSGGVDFSKYVALGDSYAAGFSDGAVFLEAQENSYPAIIARQLKMVGLSGEFKQPLMPAGNGLSSNPDFGKQQLALIDGSLLPSFLPVGDNVNQSVALQGPFQNLGVPGARSFHLSLPQYGVLNPFYQRFCSNPGAVSILDEAKAQQPTFFSMWIGGNDVLGYALDGGADTPGSEITTPEIFETSVRQVIDGLRSTNANVKGVIGNIPDLSVAPYFNFIQSQVAGTAITADQADLLNGYYGLLTFNLGLSEAQINELKGKGYYPIFAEGTGNKIVIKVPVTEDNPLGFRTLKSNEKVLLSAAAEGQFTTELAFLPKDDKYVLDSDELQAIETARVAYNAILEDVTADYDLAFADIETFVEPFLDGETIDGVNYSPTFVQGNLFSLDGIHLTQRGYAFFANEYIKAINQHYNSNIPAADYSQLPTVYFPK
ncbi:MAG: hypothetical protein IPL35_08965 [Sphingobacteriales bacterium]|nr:hypothetical protein [Sphingobacteriales bacterium]